MGGGKRTRAASGTWKRNGWTNRTRTKHSGIRVIWCIVNYRRARVAGSTYFFTVTLPNPRSGHLYCPGRPVASRLAAVRRQRPFAVDAIFLLPDHIHTVRTCRPATTLSGPLARLVARFSRALAVTIADPATGVANTNSGSGASGSI